MYPFNCLTGTELSYSLVPASHALIFQVTSQSQDITAFLKKNTYRASNGLLIAGDTYPEFKDSKNTLFLRGSDKSNDYKLDTTRFVSNGCRDSKATMIKQALKEFVGYIKKLQRPMYYYAAQKPAFDNFVVVIR